ncbi:MAG: energy-coupling factor transporter transmembrane protein EcfT [Alistipes sp.]|nr:energy-coupling factor transporter transmembrane protein EcfT [Alistipes sp.]
MTKNPTKPSILDKDNGFMSFGRIVVSVLMIIFMGILSIGSIFSTTGMEVYANDTDSVVWRMRYQIEAVVYYYDSIVGNIIWLLLCAMICFLVMPLLKKLPIWAEISVAAVWTIVLGCIWVYSSQSAPTEDSYWVTMAAQDFAHDIFSILDSRYFRDYSFQLGYVFFNETIIRIAMKFMEIKNLLFLEALNVVFLAASYGALIFINSRIFKDQRVRHITFFLILFAAQPLIFCSFLYGIIPGMTFGIFSVLFLVLYLQNRKPVLAIVYGMFSALFLAVSVMIKTNNFIILVAVMAVTFVAMFKRKKFIRDIIFMAATLAVCLSINPLVKSNYEKRAGVDLGEAIPFSAWFNMGLREAENAPGWYTPTYTVYSYEWHNYDPEETHEIAVDGIKERIDFFKNNPQYRHNFFYRKFMSQWNETSYQSIWNNQVRAFYDDQGKAASWVCGDGITKTKRYMDIYSQLIFAACLIGLLACLKNKNFLSIMLPLIILGGMMYHLLAEAKSQYSMPYFIMMIGFAGYGICTAYDKLAEKTGWRIFRLCPSTVPAEEIPCDKETIDDGVIIEIIEEIDNEPEADAIEDGTGNETENETDDLSGFLSDDEIQSIRVNQ